MVQAKRQSKADRAVTSIVEDILNRHGLANEWKQIDLDVRKDIKEKWAKLITSAMADKKNEEGAADDANGSV